MKSALGKTCQDEGRLCHNSSNCVICYRTNYFYSDFRTNLKKAVDELKRNVTDLPDNVGVCGIITFLRACFQYDSVSDDQKSGPLPDEPNSKLTDAQKFIDPDLLNKVLSANRRNSKEVDPSFVSKIFALKHKHRNTIISCVKTKVLSVKKNEPVDTNPPSSSKKSAKTKLKKEVSG